MSAPIIAVPQSDLDDLRDRLARTRWPEPWPGVGWEAGTEQAELRRLVELWAHGFDWRAREAAINELPSSTAAIDGVDVHYLRYDAEVEDALPIVITHGWPSSVLELAGLAERLAHPSRFGGSAHDALTVIVPSLPGFAFSPQRPGLDELPTHEIWHRLMHDELGFERYAAHGGDLGAGISSRLGEAHPESVVGVHVLAVANPSAVDAASVTDEEQHYLDSIDRWSAADGAYQHQQSTRPMTLAYGLSDSPAGLLAWLLEKYRGWSETPPSDEFVLTQASLYWFTNSISTSFRPYYDSGRGRPAPVRRVEVPTAVAVFPHDLTRPPRSWAERGYAVARYTRMPRGGHFAAHEQPGLLAADIAAFLAGLR